MTLTPRWAPKSDPKFLHLQNSGSIQQKLESKSKKGFENLWVKVDKTEEEVRDEGDIDTPKLILNLYVPPRGLDPPTIPGVQAPNTFETRVYRIYRKLLRQQTPAADTLLSMTQKTCAKCQIIQSKDNFTKNQSTPPWCQTCRSEYRKTHKRCSCCGTVQSHTVFFLDKSKQARKKRLYSFRSRIDPKTGETRRNYKEYSWSLFSVCKYCHRKFRKHNGYPTKNLGCVDDRYDDEFIDFFYYSFNEDEIEEVEHT